MQDTRRLSLGNGSWAKPEALKEYARNTEYKLYTSGEFYNGKDDFFEHTPIPLDSLNKEEKRNILKKESTSPFFLSNISVMGKAAILVPNLFFVLINPWLEEFYAQYSGLLQHDRITKSMANEITLNSDRNTG